MDEEAEVAMQAGDGRRACHPQRARRVQRRAGAAHRGGHRRRRPVRRSSHPRPISWCSWRTWTVPRLRIVADLPAKPEQALALVVGGVEVYLPLAGMVDLAAERERLQKELEQGRGS